MIIAILKVSAKVVLILEKANSSLVNSLFLFFFQGRLANMEKSRIFALAIRPDGGIGRRAGLKHQWIHFHAGSIPALGTKVKVKLCKLNVYGAFLFFVATER